MRFEKIHAENYCSYKTMDLPLEGLGRIFTMSGHNGSGKTTALKAMTVLLYEQTPAEGRGIARFVRDVPSWGDKDVQAAMRKKKELPILRMEGFLVHNGYRYRIIRTFDPNTKQGGHMLNLQRKPADQDAAAWETEDGVQVMNGQTISDTQALIERMFGNYRSFVTSTFMSHGISGFLDATDEDREDVAAFLFGCEGYDSRLQSATSKRLDIERSMESQTGNLPELMRVAGTRMQAQSDLDAATAAIVDADKQIEAVKKNLTTHQIDRDQLMKAIADAEASEKTAAGIRVRIAALEKQSADLQALMTNADELRSQSQALREARSVIRDQQDRYTRSSDIQREIARLTQVIAGEKLRLESLAVQIEVTLQGIVPLDPAAERAKLAETDEALELLKDTVPQIESARQGIAEMQSKDAEIRAQITQKESRQAELRENIEAIKGAAGCCPTCERSFADDAEKQLLVTKFTAEGISLKNDIVQLRADAATYAARRAAFEHTLRSLQAVDAQQRQLTSDRVRVEQRIAQADRQALEVAKLNEQVNKYRGTLAINGYAESEQVQLLESNHKAAAIGYDHAAYTSALQTERELRETEQAIARLEKADADIDTIATQADAERNALSDAMERASEAADLRTQAATLSGAIAQLNQDMESAQNRKAAATSSNAVAERAIAAAVAAAKGAEAITAALGDQRKRVAILRVLEQAYRPQGIPAMKYDRYLPTLNNKVNYVLGMLSPGWATSITSQVGTRGKFTIPIDTVDPDGISKMYASRSNGEKFILALAFQVAMGLFWGERTGAQPQHIFIDEGFGALDPQNLEKAKAAISAVSVNFGQVGIISHIPELNAIGQVQLQVYKGKDGSAFEISGTGSGTARVRKHFMFEPDQWGAIATGLGVIKEEMPGASDEKALEAAVVGTALNVEPRQQKRARRR